jgi:hypothetical protein
LADDFPVWPRRRSTSAALVALLVVQVALFFAITQRSFFASDDYYHFKLAQERHLLQYLATPIIHTYPAPGHRLVFFLLHELFPLNYVAARAFLFGVLAATTIVLGQFVRTLARSEQWWTVALLVPFALSITFVEVGNWWSSGVPVFPALFFTVIAFSAWFRSYLDPNRSFWAGVTVIAVAAAGSFYMKFLLIPVYLLVFRLAIFPRLLDVPDGIRPLWQEWRRWLALAAAPTVFVAVYVLSGLAARSYVPGNRPFLEYLAIGWFRAFIPASFLNVPVDESTPAIASWAAVVCSQVLFWVVVWATWKRSSLAVRGWALVVIAFATNMVMVGAVRLPGFGVNIAYRLRYYPEIILFLPVALALSLRQGEERRAEVAWERTALGQTAIGMMACLYVVSFIIWAPRIVSHSEGVQARAWFENLRQDLRAVAVDNAVLRIVDSETPEYVIPAWLAPYNRISTILALLHRSAIYSNVSGPTYLLQDNGRLVEAAFRPVLLLLSGSTPGEGVRLIGGDRGGAVQTCLRGTDLVLFHPEADIAGERLAIRMVYSRERRGIGALEVDTYDPGRRFHFLELRPFERDAELIDLGTSRLRALKLEASPGEMVCIERMEIGSLRK